LLTTQFKGRVPGILKSGFLGRRTQELESLVQREIIQTRIWAKGSVLPVFILMNIDKERLGCLSDQRLPSEAKEPKRLTVKFHP